MNSKHSFIRRVLSHLGLKPLSVTTPPKVTSAHTSATAPELHPVRRASDLRARENASLVRARTPLVPAPPPRRTMRHDSDDTTIAPMTVPVIVPVFEEYRIPVRIQDDDEDERRRIQSGGGGVFGGGGATKVWEAPAAQVEPEVCRVNAPTTQPEYTAPAAAPASAPEASPAPD